MINIKKAMSFEKLCKYAMFYAEEKLEQLDNSIAVEQDDEQREFLEMWRDETITELGELEDISRELRQMFYEKSC